MNRVIKFRAWDKVNKKWLFGYKEMGGFNLLGEVVLLGELNSIKLTEWNNIEINQFTGLYDKNGKEVYEGDIFEVIIGDLQYIVSHGRIGDRIKTYGIVEFAFGCFTLKYKNEDGEEVYSPLHKFLKKGKEVIGNIYENPKLLK